MRGGAHREIMMNCGKAEGDKVRVQVKEGGREREEKNRHTGGEYGEGKKAPALPKQ